MARYVGHVGWFSSFSPIFNQVTGLFVGQLVQQEFILSFWCTVIPFPVVPPPLNSSPIYCVPCIVPALDHTRRPRGITVFSHLLARTMLTCCPPCLKRRSTQVNISRLVSRFSSEINTETTKTHMLGRYSQAVGLKVRLLPGLVANNTTQFSVLFVVRLALAGSTVASTCCLLYPPLYSPRQIRSKTLCSIFFLSAAADDYNDLQHPRPREPGGVLRDLPAAAGRPADGRSARDADRHDDFREHR